jgi:hypothetical protein
LAYWCQGNDLYLFIGNSTETHFSAISSNYFDY